MVKRKATAPLPGRVAKRPRLMTAQKVATIARKAVMKVSETKKISQQVSELNLNTNGGVATYGCVSLAEGTSQAERVGHKVHPIGIDIRGHIINNVQNRPLIVKMMVVRQKDMLANQNTELLENNSGNQSITTNSIAKMYQRINSDSFEVLHTKYFTFQGEAYKQFRIFKSWIPLKKIRTLHYEGSATAAPNYNDIFVVFFGADAENDAANITYELSFERNFYFKDP